MTRYLLIVVVIALATLFYPWRDLYVRDNPFDEDYVLVKKGFWTRDACIDAAMAQAAEDFRCRKRTMFGGMLSTSARYGQSGPDNLEPAPR